MTRNEFMKQMKEELMGMLPEDLRKGLTIQSYLGTVLRNDLRSRTMEWSPLSLSSGFPDSF